MWSIGAPASRAPPNLEARTASGIEPLKGKRAEPSAVQPADTLSQELPMQSIRVNSRRIDYIRKWSRPEIPDPSRGERQWC